jgi:hypothetical protein
MVRTRDCNAGDLDIDKTWLPKYKEFFRAFCASAGDPPSSCLGLLRDASHRCQNRQLKISEASAEKSESLSWLRELGCLQTLIECGFSVFEAPPDLVVISASSFRTAFVFEYAKRLFDFATQLMVVVCVTDGEELRVVAQSSAPEVSFVHRGLEQTASAFGFCPIPRLLSNRHQLENESERGMAACSILSFEGGEVWKHCFASTFKCSFLKKKKRLLMELHKRSQIGWILRLCSFIFEVSDGW